MPLLKVAQKHEMTFDPPPAGLYHFCEEHRAGWSEFWKSMKGSLEKVVDWAKTADVEEPEAWANELYCFLFGTYSGNPKLYKRAAASNFPTFLAQAAENHINDPKGKWWYVNHGINHRDFVRIMERASAIEDLQGCIHYINARIPDLGFKLYEEYLLSKAGYLDQKRRVASGMRKKAYETEKAICGDLVLPEKDETVRHLYHPGEELRVLNRVEDVLLVEDTNGTTRYIADPWNLG